MTDNVTDILLVEDNTFDVDLAFHSLNRNRITDRIHVARDGKEALDFLFCQGLFANRKAMARPLLVLLDLTLPKLSGLEVFREIKGDARTEKIAVIILVSGEADLDFQAALRLRPDAFMAKPVTFEKLFPVAKRLGLSFLLLPSEIISQRS